MNSNLEWCPRLSATLSSRRCRTLVTLSRAVPSCSVSFASITTRLGAGGYCGTYHKMSPKHGVAACGMRKISYHVPFLSYGRLVFEICVLK